MFISFVFFSCSFQVEVAVQQPGYLRSKRGYQKQIRGVPIHDVTAHKNNAKPGSIPNDPLYSKEWYIVSSSSLISLLLISFKII